MDALFNAQPPSSPRTGDPGLPHEGCPWGPAGLEGPHKLELLNSGFLTLAEAAAVRCWPHLLHIIT
eukprot:1157799-Pelagomonas_calceolata.AAC.10